MARYIEIEREQIKAEKGYHHAVNRYALERKYNKCKPHELFEHIIAGKDPINYLYHSANKDSWNALESFMRTPKWIPQVKNDMINLVRHILKKSPNYLNDKDNIKALKGISELYPERLRNIEDWKPKRINTHAQLPDLLHFLFAKYPVPYFLINGFRNYNMDSILLYQHIGAGRSLKTFDLVPDFNVPKKAFHHLQTTPDHCTFNEGFRRAQILSMGGDDRLFNTLMDSRLGTFTNTPYSTTTHKEIKKEQEDFWLTVIRFFVDHTMINNDKIPQIVDYIYDQKYTLKRINQPDGSFINRPDQPNFTIKGRTPMSLINQSDNWHEFLVLNKKRIETAKSWEPVNINDYIFENGLNRYKIVQLTTTKELVSEGNDMHHCVATYASSCINGNCSIFSLRHSNEQLGYYNQSFVTIEVRGTSVVQIRGKYNKPPQTYHMQLIRNWIDQNDLRLSKYITA